MTEYKSSQICSTVPDNFYSVSDVCNSPTLEVGRTSKRNKRQRLSEVNLEPHERFEEALKKLV